MLGLIVALVSVLIFAGIPLTIYLIKNAKRNIARERLFELKLLTAKAGKGGSTEQSELDVPFFERVIQPILEKTSAKMKKDPNRADPTSELIHRAGNPGNLTSGQFKALQLLCSVVSIMFGVLLMPVMGSLLEGGAAFGIIIGAVFAGFAFIGPKFWLQKRVTTRQKGVRRSLPDVLDLLCVSVEAGLGFDQALQKVCERMKNPLTEEFERMLQEVKIGKSRKDALKSMGHKCQVEELDSLISAIIQADALGVSIGRLMS